MALLFTKTAGAIHVRLDASQFVRIDASQAKGGIVIFDNEGFFSGSSYDEFSKAICSSLSWMSPSNGFTGCRPPIVSATSFYCDLLL